MLTDESNKEQSDEAQFFIYGGLCVPSAAALDLHREIDSIRARFKYGAQDQLKFDTNKRPKHVSSDEAKEAKKLVIEACFKAECVFFAVCTLHTLARTRSIDERFRWSLNTLVGHFDMFLRKQDHDAHGILLVDRLPIPNPDKQLIDLFSLGLDFKDGKRSRLDRVIAYSTVAQGASHLCSAIDIVLGTFRYCVNAKEETESVRNMASSVMRLMWHQRVNDVRRVKEFGLLIRPKTIQVEEHQMQYGSLVERLQAYLLVPQSK